jgi:hypothetical protein
MRRRTFLKGRSTLLAGTAVLGLRMQSDSMCRQWAPEGRF